MSKNLKLPQSLYKIIFNVFFYYFSLLIIAIPSIVFSQDFPNHPIRIIVPYGPGGVTDITARTIAPYLSQYLSQNIIIDNRPGGSTMIGTEAVIRSQNDGYTLLLNSGAAMSANPSLFKKVPYDVIKELIPISLLTTVPYVLVVSNSLPVTSPQDFINFAKSHNGSLNYSSAGNGSGNHLSAELIMISASIKAQHIPYKSGSEMVMAVISGQVSFSVSALPSASAQIKSGNLKAIALTSRDRSSSQPNIPTLNETVLPNFNLTEWLGFFAPNGTSANIIDKLSIACKQALLNPELIDKLKVIGAEINYKDGSELSKLLKADVLRWNKLAQDVKFEMQ